MRGRASRTARSATARFSAIRRSPSWAAATRRPRKRTSSRATPTKVYLIHRRDELRASKILQQRLFANPKIEVIWNTVVEEVNGDEQGLVKNSQAARTSRRTRRATLAATGLFVFIGFRPNTGIIDGHVDHDDMGYCVTDANMQTSIRGLFAAGDVRVAAHASGDDRRRRRDDGGDRRREVSQGAAPTAIRTSRSSAAAATPCEDRRRGRSGRSRRTAYLVVDEATDRAVLIDPGDEPDELIAMVRASGATLDAIWLTHAHLDHIGGDRRRAARVERARCTCTRATCRCSIARAEQARRCTALPFEQPEEPDAELAEGDVLRVGDRCAFDVMHTPGHAPGHVVFDGDGVVFGGDLLFAGSIGRTDLPLGDPARMEESLERIAASSPTRRVVHPGHGPRTTIGRERATNPFLTGARAHRVERSVIDALDGAGARFDCRCSPLARRGGVLQCRRRAGAVRRASVAHARRGSRRARAARVYSGIVVGARSSIAAVLARRARASSRGSDRRGVVMVAGVRDRAVRRRAAHRARSRVESAGRSRRCRADDPRRVAFGRLHGVERRAGSASRCSPPSSLDRASPRVTLPVVRPALTLH